MPSWRHQRAITSSCPSAGVRVLACLARISTPWLMPWANSTNQRNRDRALDKDYGREKDAHWGERLKCKAEKRFYRGFTRSTRIRGERERIRRHGDRETRTHPEVDSGDFPASRLGDSSSRSRPSRGSKADSKDQRASRSALLPRDAGPSGMARLAGKGMIGRAFPYR